MSWTRPETAARPVLRRRRSAPCSPSACRGRPTRANFRTGHLTICTLVPMRSVPHRVVCLLGLDDGVFPRKSPRDGDDLMLDDPHVGDRDPRTEDRQLLLDALLAATDRLIVTYTGNDERTNLAKPPGGAGRRAARRRSTARSAQTKDPRASGSWSATRCSRSTRATSPSASSCPSGRGASTPSRSTAPALTTERAAPRRSSPGRCRRTPLSSSSSRTSCASSGIRSARSCASGSASASGTTPTRSRTRCRSSSTRSSVGRRAAAARRASSRARASRPASPPRSRAGRCRPASSPSP